MITNLAFEVTPMFAFSMKRLQSRKNHKDPGNQHVHPNRTYCKCKSACKSKKNNGTDRGCPYQTANLPCVATLYANVELRGNHMRIH